MTISEVEEIFEQLPTSMLYVVLVMKRAAARHNVGVHDPRLAFFKFVGQHRDRVPHAFRAIRRQSTAI